MTFLTSLKLPNGTKLVSVSGTKLRSTEGNTVGAAIAFSSISLPSEIVRFHEPFFTWNCFNLRATVGYAQPCDVANFLTCEASISLPNCSRNWSTKLTDSFLSKGIIKKGNQKKLFLGNLYSKRDWGHARDYVEAMWKMLQQKKPADYVIATGKTFTIKEFVNKAAKKIGFKIRWVGNGFNEKAIDIKNKKVIIECKRRYFRPVEVDYLKGNANKAKKLLKWYPKTSLDKLIDEMIRYELKFYNDKL